MGWSWVPNVPHVFRQDQHLYFLYEVYDAGAGRRMLLQQAASPGLTRREGGPVRVLTSIEFMMGGVKVYETPLVEATAVNVPERGAVAFHFDVPLAQVEARDLRLPGERRSTMRGGASAFRGWR